MRKLTIDSQAFLSSPNDKKFVILATEQASTKEFIERNILPKINTKPSPMVPGFWGTLGFENDDKIDWKGHLEISSYGNDSFTGVVKDEVEIIKSCFPDLQQNPTSIIERFISFEHLNFNFPEAFTLDSIPSLRLDIMLEPSEGAIVFYQSEKDSTEDTTIEYILPKATEGNNTSERDRLTYIFNVIPQHKIEPLDSVGSIGLYQLSTTREAKPFIIKIITFKRQNEFKGRFKRENSKDIINRVLEVLGKRSIVNHIAKDHQLLVFDEKKNNFVAARSGLIDPNLKTLFLMHGTFGSTEASFGKLCGKNSSWLKDLMKAKSPSPYRQIIAFDHPTVFYGAEENIAMLFLCFNELNIQSFTHEVDFIGTSQGGLLIQYLANIENDRIKVGKAALIASANGVDYLTVGKYVSTFLTVLKYIFKHTGLQAQALVAALAQHSAEFLLNQPGFQIMTPGHEKLYAIINTPPRLQQTVYLPIIDDYNESIFDDEDRKLVKFFKKIGARITDGLAQLIMGEYNDWVVSTKNQYIIPASHCAIPGYNPSKYRTSEFLVPAIHGTCVNKEKTQKLLKDFLINYNTKPVPIQNNTDFFDAHCHIFGREIISGRIIMLLLQELLSYQKAKDNSGKLPVVPQLTRYISNDEEGETGSVAKNIIKYFALNKDSFQMLNDLEKEYYELKSGVYRYIPLMFDLEMTFRNKYYENDVENSIDQVQNEFDGKIKEFINDIENLVDKFEKAKESIFNGSLVENEESVRVLKIILFLLKSLNNARINLKDNTKNGYIRQIEELKGLKVRYGNNLFPFLATDPRRKGMSGYITDNVGRDNSFYGIKMYAPNGYSPTDPLLFEDEKAFINGQCLYAYCIENRIPIMAHCSNAGFSTFAMELEVCGDILVHDPNGDIIITDENGNATRYRFDHYATPTLITFNSSLTNGGFALAVRERACALNHPRIWRKVLERYPELTLCLAHFGGESIEWRMEIAKLMRDYDNVYTDLSCMTDEKKLIQIKADYFDKNDPVTEKIMYGSDFFLNMLGKIEFEDYYKHFKKVFSIAQIKKMSLDVPVKFLGL